MAKRSKLKKARRMHDQMEPQQRAMLETVASMAQVLSCPVSTAVEHSEYSDNQAADSKSRASVARLAVKLHANPGKVETDLVAVLDDFATVMDRHHQELSAIAARFAQLKNHDEKHAHLEADAIPLGELAALMFGPSPDEAPVEQLP